MKNKEIEELLNKMKTILKTYKELKVEPTLCEELITTGELNLLLSYIEQLEEELKEEQEENYKQSEWLVKKQKKIEQLENDYKEANESVTWWQNRFNAVERDKKQLENNRDKAIEYVEHHKFNKFGDIDCNEAEDIIDILKGDSDD